MNTGRAPREPFADALADAISTRDVSLTWLRARLIDSGNPIALATLSSWRSGQRRPEGVTSMAVVDAVEVILGRPIGSLSALLEPPRKTGRPVRVRADVDSDESTQLLLSTLTAMGCTPRDLAGHTSSHTMIEVDADRCQRTFISRFMLEAPRDDYHCVPFAVALPEIADPERERTDDPFPSIAGGRRGRSVVDDATGCYGVVVELDPPLRRGEQAIVEITFVAPTGLTDTYFDQVVPKRQHETVVWVRFHPDAIPTRIEAGFGLDGDRTVEEIDPRGESAHLALRDFGPGLVGIRWEW